MEIFYYYSFSLFLGGIVALFSGLSVFLKDRKASANQKWFLTNIATSVWSFGYFSMINASSKEAAWISNWVLHAAAIFIPTLYLHFCLAITKTEKALSYKIFLSFAYAFSVFFFIVNPTTAFVRDVLPKYVFNYVCDAGPLYIYFTIQFWFWVILATVVLLKAFLKAQGLAAQQLKYVLLSEIGFIGGGSVFFLTFNINFPPYLILLFSLYPLVVAYAIIKHRLMGIRVIASKLYLYSLTALFSFVFFYAIYLICQTLLGETGKILPLFLLFLISIIFAVFFVPVFSWIQKTSDIIFYNGRNPATVIKELSIKLSGIFRKEDLLQVSREELKKVLKSQGVKIILKENIPTDASPFLKELLEAGELLVQNEISEQNSDVKRRLKENQVEIALPLKKDKQRIGMIFIDQKTNQDAYTKEEIDFLEVIARQLVGELGRIIKSNF